MEYTDSALTEIHQLRTHFYQLALGKDSLLRLMAEAEVPEQVYDSNAFES